jgi:hypothetical protein
MKGIEALAWIVISLLFPIGGIIGGIIKLLQQKSDEGMGLLLIGLISWVMWASMV